MVTKNWYGIFKATSGKTAISNALTDCDGNKTTAGYYYNGDSLMMTALGFRISQVVYRYNIAGIVLGSGTTPATIHDYKLEALITSGLSASHAASLDENKNTVHTLTITNVSSEDITIGEVGIIANAYIGSSSSSSSSAYVLTERTVLDAPLTIPAGGVGVLTYLISLIEPEA